MTGDICEHAPTGQAYNVADETIKSRGLVFGFFLPFLLIHSLILIRIASQNPRFINCIKIQFRIKFHSSGLEKFSVMQSVSTVCYKEYGLSFKVVSATAL